MTEEFKSILTLVVGDFKKNSKEAKDAIKGVKDEMEGVAKAGKDADKGFRSFGKGADGATGGIRNLIGWLKRLLSITALVKAAQKAITEGASAMASEAQFSQVFGALEQNAKAALEAIAEETGFTAYSMRNAFSGIASFAKVSGMETAEALSLTERAMRAATDNAAFYDRELEDVVENMKGYLKGNYANDAALGISSTETTRNAMAMQLYGRAFKDLTETQKQWTLLAQIEQANQLSGALGQAARESNNWSTNVQRLKSYFQQLWAVLGKGLIAVFNPILTAINTIMGALVSFANTVSTVFSEVFGTESKTFSLEDTATSAEVAAGGMNDFADATTKAAEAAQRLQRNLMGFDEINRLQSNASAGGGGAGGAGGSALGVTKGAAAEANGLLDQVIGKSNELSAAMERFKAWLQGLDFKPIQKSFDNLKKTVEPFVGLIKDGLHWGLTHVLEPLAKWTIEKAAPAGIDLLSEALGAVYDVLMILKPVAKWIWDNFLAPLAKETGDAFVGGLKVLTEVLKKIRDMLKDIRAVMDGKMSLGQMLSKWFSPGDLNGTSVSLGKVWTQVQKIVKYVQNPISFAISLSKKGWSSISDWAEKNKGANSIAYAITLINSGWKTVKDWVSKKVGGATSQAVSLAASGWTTVSAWAKKHLGSTLTLTVQLAGNLKSWVNNTLLKPLENAIRGIKIAGVKPFSSVTIPKLAHGGIATAPTVGMFGEDGREAILPLERNTGWMDTLADKLASRTGGTNAPQRITVQCVLDGRIVAQNTIDYINGEARRTGYNPLAPGL